MVQLLADGSEVKDGLLELNDDNFWTGTITNLIKFNADGAIIAYTWKEVNLPEGYELIDTNVNGTITALTNAHKPEEISLTIKKVWDDLDNQDGIRPDSIEVVLSNGMKVILSDDNEWTSTIPNLPKYAEGKEIEYSWNESVLPDGYEMTGNVTEGFVTTITNTHKPEMIDISITKVWDNEGADFVEQPKEVIVHLLANNNKVKTFTLGEENNWFVTIHDLPVFENGEKIEYSVLEDEVMYYETFYSGDAINGFTVLNHVVPIGDGVPPSDEEPPTKEDTPPYTGIESTDNLDYNLISHLLITMVLVINMVGLLVYRKEY